MLLPNIFLLLVSFNFSTDLHRVEKNNDQQLETGWYYVDDNKNGLQRQSKIDSVLYNLNPIPIVTVKNIKQVKLGKNKSGAFFLLMRFDEEGTRIWSDATKKSIGKQLAFIIDDELIFVPTVMSQITGGVSAINTISYTKNDLINFKSTVKKEMH